MIYMIAVGVPAAFLALSVWFVRKAESDIEEGIAESFIEMIDKPH